MQFVKISFWRDGEYSLLDKEFVNAVNGLVGAWLKNGQALSRDSHLVEEAHSLCFYVLAPDADSFHEKNLSIWGANALDKLTAKFAGHYSVTPLGRAPEVSGPCDCLQSSHYILFTNLLECSPPICCGDCFRPVRLYTLPADKNGEHSDMWSWNSDYQSCDRLQMNCGSGERFGERQMRDINSALTKQGRAICGDIESRTGVPTLYYLYQPRARSYRADTERLCPGCGAAWRLETRQHDLFDFRCDPCRLLSSIASTVAYQAPTRPAPDFTPTPST
jgi:predicted  nucleic acid-binding Zn ribbon protein